MLVIMSDGEATTREAAEAVRVHIGTLQRWAKEGIVTPAYTTAGGRYRWDIEDLKRQLKALHDAK